MHGYKLNTVTLIDTNNYSSGHYDQDYYGGTLTNGSFGVSIAGAAPRGFITRGQTATANPPLGQSGFASLDYTNKFFPQFTIQTTDDGLPIEVGADGMVSGTTYTGVNGGRFASTQDSAVVIGNKQDDDPSPSSAYTVSAITKANPAVVTFAANTTVHTSSGYNPRGYFKSVGGMNQINGTAVYLKSIAYNQAEVYTDSGHTAGLDSSGFSTFTSGGIFEDVDDHQFDQGTAGDRIS